MKKESLIFGFGTNPQPIPSLAEVPARDFQPFAGDYLPDEEPPPKFTAEDLRIVSKFLD